MLVLLPVSACRVVVADGMGPMGVEVWDPPQHTRRPVSHSDPNAVKQRGRDLVFTETTPRKCKPHSALLIGAEHQDAGGRLRHLVEYYTFASVDGQPRPNYSRKAIALKDARNRDSERNGLLTTVSLSESGVGAKHPCLF